MWNENDFCDADSGFDYIFSMMSATYGARFASNWQDVDPQIVRHVWKEKLGRFLTYKPSLDFALAHLKGDFPPSAITFRDLCNAGPDIPVKPVQQIAHQMTQEQKDAIEAHKAKARAWLAQMKGKK